MYFEWFVVGLENMLEFLIIPCGWLSRKLFLKSTKATLMHFINSNFIDSAMAKRLYIKDVKV
jgi:hypothetical protein